MSVSGETISQQPRLTVNPLRTNAQQVVVLGGLVAAVVSALGGFPVAWVIFSVVTLAGARSSGPRGVIERLPAAGVFVIAGIGAVALAAGLLGVDVMSAPWSGRLLLVGLAVALVTVALVLERGGTRSGTLSWTELTLAAAPAAFMAVIGAALAASPLGAKTSWFLSGDHLRHLGLVTRTIDAGGLEYDSQTYPRAWHSVVALLWSVTDAERDAQGLAELIRLQALSSWIVLTLIPLALALTAAVIHRAAGGVPPVVGLSGAATGCLVLGPRFFGDHVPRGFETSLLALLLLAAAVLRVTESRADRGALVVVAVSGALLCHVWQVLLPAMGALLVVVLLSRWRRRPAPKVLAADVCILLVSAALSLPGVLGVARGYGLGAAGIGGDVPPLVLGWLALVLAAAVFLLVTRRMSPGVACLTCATAVLVTALALAEVAQVGLQSYYPNKTLWTATALGLPLIGAAGACLIEQSFDLPRLFRPLVLVAGALAGSLLVLYAATPAVGVAGSWSTADGELVMETVTSDTARSATVVWGVGTETDDATSQLLLDFYTATSTSVPLGLAPRTVEEQCALLVQAREPVVLSVAPEAEVRARFGCVPGLHIVRPGNRS